jgi:hypothetical protein
MLPSRAKEEVDEVTPLGPVSKGQAGAPGASAALSPRCEANDDEVIVMEDEMRDDDFLEVIPEVRSGRARATVLEPYPSGTSSTSPSSWITSPLL